MGPVFAPRWGAPDSDARRGCVRCVVRRRVGAGSAPRAASAPPTRLSALRSCLPPDCRWSLGWAPRRRCAPRVRWLRRPSACRRRQCTAIRQRTADAPQRIAELPPARLPVESPWGTSPALRIGGALAASSVGVSAQAVHREQPAHRRRASAHCGAASRPTAGGVSVGHLAGDARRGCVGCVVRRRVGAGSALRSDSAPSPGLSALPYLTVAEVSAAHGRPTAHRRPTSHPGRQRTAGRQQRHRRRWHVP